MKQRYIDTSVVGGFFKKEKSFDCVKMKDEIPAKRYGETKDMTFEELKAYLFVSPDKDPFRKHNE
ncbi:MAG: hypothetical protein LBT50_08020 [Prevotellaceae bacterium]|jgi:hypothetical protein|nr:hypothetical protein [Prevotellaceae bacterium]